MKRQVLQGLVIMLICFLLGGTYIIYAIGRATNQLECAVTMHQLNDAIKVLHGGIKKVKIDSQQQNFLRKNDLLSLQTATAGLQKNLENSFYCEGSKELLARLEQLQLRNKDYTLHLNNLLNLAPGTIEYQNEVPALLQQGTEFTQVLNFFVNNISGEFTSRSEVLFRDITQVKHLVIFLVIIGPISILFITAYFLRRFTGSIDTLVQASSVLESGNLDFHIDNNLKHEFKQLADSFNSMSHSLKLQRDDLQTARKMYQRLFESAGDGIFILDLAEGREGLIISANPAAAVMHSYEVEELSGMNIADLSGDNQCHERLRCASSGSWVQYTVQRKKKNGERFLAEVSVGLLNIDELKYALVFSRDITQQKKVETRLQRANQMALVGEMAAGLAHEIKNPLAGIKVTLEVLADELELNEEDQDLFARVINETTRVEKLLKGLLNYARPPKLYYERFDLNMLLDSSIRNSAVAGKTSSRAGVEFVRCFAVDLPQLEADSAQLQQVFLNIFLNAIEAMAEGGQINVSTRKADEKSLELEITDTGKGIPEAALVKVFRPFMTTKSKGTGLGLAICKRIIEDHGGSIAAGIYPAGGTRFTIILPLNRPEWEEM